MNIKHLKILSIGIFLAGFSFQSEAIAVRYSSIKASTGSFNNINNINNYNNFIRSGNTNNVNVLGQSSIGSRILIKPTGSTTPGTTIISGTNISFNMVGSGCVFSGAFLLGCTEEGLGVANAVDQITPPISPPISPDIPPAAVPLPASIWLLFSGLIGLLTIGRRKVAV